MGNWKWGGGKQKASLVQANLVHQADVYLQFPWHETTENISIPPWMGCQSIAGCSPANAGTHLCSWVERGKQG